MLSTALFQIWQGTKQKEFGVSAMQLQSAIATWQSVQSFAVAAAVEFYCWTDTCTGPTAIDFFKSSMGSGEAAAHTIFVLKLVLGTCFLALMVNFCSFGLIGRTSPITFQVGPLPEPVGRSRPRSLVPLGVHTHPSPITDPLRTLSARWWGTRRHASCSRAATSSSR